jgi:ADP-heptose:LPS heptosyltransferase
VAHAGDRPWFKSWPVDELLAYPDEPMATGEIFAALAPGPEPAPFRPGNWQQPACSGFALPPAPFAILHVGASTPLKLWPAANWQALAQRLGARGIGVVWSGGAGEEALVRRIDPEQRYRSYAGTLDLAQLWHLMAAARLFVSGDTGVAHLARLTGVPSVTLFGPGSPQLFGRGRFWRETPSTEVALADMPCRDQDDLFERRRPWIRRCRRTPRQCHHAARCMAQLDVGRVEAAIERLWATGGATRP